MVDFFSMFKSAEIHEPCSLFKMGTSQQYSHPRAEAQALERHRSPSPTCHSRADHLVPYFCLKTKF